MGRKWYVVMMSDLSSFSPFFTTAPSRQFAYGSPLFIVPPPALIHCNHVTWSRSSFSLLLLHFPYASTISDISSGPTGKRRDLKHSEQGLEWRSGKRLLQSFC